MVAKLLGAAGLLVRYKYVFGVFPCGARCYWTYFIYIVFVRIYILLWKKIYICHMNSCYVYSHHIRCTPTSQTTSITFQRRAAKTIEKKARKIKRQAKRIDELEQQLLIAARAELHAEADPTGETTFPATPSKRSKPAAGIQVPHAATRTAIFLD